MARILVTPEQVHEVGSQFQNASQESDQMVNRLQSTMSGLDPDWEGMTQERFYSDYEQWRTQMVGFVDLLNQIGEQLHNIAVRFEQADQQA